MFYNKNKKMIILLKKKKEKRKRTKRIFDDEDELILTALCSFKNLSFIPQSSRLKTGLNNILFY